MLAELLIFTVVVLFWWILTYQSKFQKLYNKLPGPKPYPIIGNLLEFNYPKEVITETFKKLASRYGPVYRLTLGQEPMVCISSPEFVEILYSKNNSFIDKAPGYKVLHPLLGEGLFTSSGEKWKKQKMIINPAFHIKILESFVPIFEKNSKILVENMSRRLNKSGSELELNIVPLIMACSLDIICETAMGLETNTQRDNTRYLDTINELTKISARRRFSFLQNSFLFPLLPTGRRFKKLLSYFHGVTENIIKERKLKYSRIGGSSDSQEGNENEGQARPKQRKIFLDLMLEYNLDGAGLTDRELRDQINTFMIAGHDTVHSAVCFALYSLSHHPQIQDIAYQEVLQVLGDDGNDATYQDLQKMRYLEKVIKETLRLYPAAVFASRVVREDVDLKNGYIIPKNTSVTFLLEEMYHDPKLHPDPMKFDPERFEQKNFHPYSYIPFGTGIRNCIGQRFAMLEMKSMISRILRKFQLMPMNIPLNIEYSIVPQSSEVYIRFKPR